MRSPSRQVLLTILAALAGLCAAVALAVLTSHLSTQRIGLAGEPPNAGRRLVAPAQTSTTTATTTAPRRRKPARTTIAPAPALAPVATAPVAPTALPALTVERHHDNEHREPHHDDDD